MCRIFSFRLPIKFVLIVKNFQKYKPVRLNIPANTTNIPVDESKTCVPNDGNIVTPVKLIVRCSCRFYWTLQC